jgi:hypothetical protein
MVRFLIASVFLSSMSAFARDNPHDVQHIPVYQVAGRFGGWPANHGIWSWGNEILVGFSAGYHKDLGLERHNIDREKPEEHLLARSLDGGLSWNIENPADHGSLLATGKALHGIADPNRQEKPWQEPAGGIDFSHPDFAMTIRMMDNHVGPSRYYYSLDRGHRWVGPFRLPDVGTQGIAARTDYIVLSKDHCMLFVTAAKSNKREGRPCCVETKDGGRSWSFVSYIGDEPMGYSIMPSTVRLGSEELLTSIRCRFQNKTWIEVFRSRDVGKSWSLETKPVVDLGEGNPPSMVRLRDGRICLTYGYRAAPYGVRAVLSSDQGKTWSPEIHLRDDGGGRDIGYPRTIERPDGKLVTIYYFHEKPASDRTIVATLWTPSNP